MVLAPATTGPARVALSGGATTGLLGGSRSSMPIDGVALEEAACRSAQAPEVLHAEGHGPLALLRVPLTWFASACSPAAGLAPCVWTVASPCGRPGPSAAGPSAVPGRGEELGVTRVSAMAWLPGLGSGVGRGLMLEHIVAGHRRRKVSATGSNKDAPAGRVFCHSPYQAAPYPHAIMG